MSDRYSHVWVFDGSSLIQDHYKCAACGISDDNDRGAGCPESLDWVEDDIEELAEEVESLRAALRDVLDAFTDDREPASTFGPAMIRSVWVAEERIDAARALVDWEAADKARGAHHD